MIVVFTAHTARARIRCPCTLKPRSQGMAMISRFAKVLRDDWMLLCFIRSMTSARNDAEAL
jgi:hypothetical protein